MDYVRQPLLFKLKKVARYVRLYGPRRTLVKVRGQYHKQRTYETLPAMDPRSLEDPKRHVGLLGCGNYAYSVIAHYLRKNHGRVVRGAMDRNLERAASLFEGFGVAYYTDDAMRIIDDPEIDLVYIASNHASHAEYAIPALERGKSVHIEKPHVVSRDQLVRLCRAMRDSSGRVNLGFNRPYSAIGRKIKRSLDAQEGPAMFNWFVAGHEIDPDHWYFKEEEGGRVLGNLCHWTDFIFQMVPPAARYPLRIVPARAQQSDCDIAVNYVFGDGTIGAITFSAKGHTFEGVRESLSAHRGNVLIAMSDFKELTIEDVEKKHRHRALFRDHGHERSVETSYAMTERGGATHAGRELAYVWETAELFLQTKRALEEQQEVVVQPYSPDRLAG